MASQASPLLPDPTCLYLSQREASQNAILMGGENDRQSGVLPALPGFFPGHKPWPEGETSAMDTAKYPLYAQELLAS